MSLLPALFRNQDALPTLGRKIERPSAPKAADPITLFNKGEHLPSGFAFIGMDPASKDGDVTAIVRHAEATIREVLFGKTPVRVIVHETADEIAARTQAVLDASAEFERNRTKYRNRLYELQQLGFEPDTRELRDILRPFNYLFVREKPTAQRYRDAQQYIEERAIKAGYHFDVGTASFTHNWKR